MFPDSAETHFAYTMGFLSWSSFGAYFTKEIYRKFMRIPRHVPRGLHRGGRVKTSHPDVYIEKERDSRWIILFAGPVRLARKWAGLPRGCRPVRVSRTRRKEICEKETRKSRWAREKDAYFARGKKKESQKIGLWRFCFIKEDREIIVERSIDQSVSAVEKITRYDNETARLALPILRIEIQQVKKQGWEMRGWGEKWIKSKMFLPAVSERRIAKKCPCGRE